MAQIDVISLMVGILALLLAIVGIIYGVITNRRVTTDVGPPGPRGPRGPAGPAGGATGPTGPTGPGFRGFTNVVTLSTAGNTITFTPGAFYQVTTTANSVTLSSGDPLTRMGDFIYLAIPNGSNIISFIINVDSQFVFADGTLQQDLDPGAVYQLVVTKLSGNIRNLTVYQYPADIQSAS